MFTSDYKDWEFNDSYATHSPTNITWWIYSDFISFRTEGHAKIKLGFVYKRRLWRWLKLAQLMQAIKYEKIEPSVNMPKDEKKEIFKQWEELQKN